MKRTLAESDKCKIFTDQKAGDAADGRAIAGEITRNDESGVVKKFSRNSDRFQLDRKDPGCERRQDQLGEQNERDEE